MGDSDRVDTLMFGEPVKKTLITTRTGEPYQPSRVYYQVFNQKTVIGAFKKLRCMQWEPRLNAWRWLYDQEARKIRFDVSWNQVPKEHRPIVLGDFYFRGSTEMVLDVRSFQRVIHAIQFFDKHINRRAARVTKLRVVNKFFNMDDRLRDEQLHPPFDYFFDREDLDLPDPVAFARELEKTIQEQTDEGDRIQAFSSFLEERSKQPLPEIEEIPAHFYEDGIASLEMALMMRTVEARQHWAGNTKFTQFDLISDMVQAIRDEFGDDVEAEADKVPDQEADRETDQEDGREIQETPQKAEE
jgi:hypothetical protein